MSAFLVSQDALRLIVNASTSPGKDAFDMLLEQNLRSLRARYSDATGFEAEAAGYTFEAETPAAIMMRVRGVDCDPAVVLSQITLCCDCYDYQSCETGDYETTSASKFVHIVRAKAVEEGAPRHGAAIAACSWDFG